MTRLIDADALLEAICEPDILKVAHCISLVRDAPTVQQSEPFGYFKAEPFGWTDCAETDEGAIALYEAPTVQCGGWISVPIEPTEEMKDKAWQAYIDSNKPAPYNRLADAYKAMIQAAPTLKEKG